MIQKINTIIRSEIYVWLTVNRYFMVFDHQFRLRGIIENSRNLRWRN